MSKQVGDAGVVPKSTSVSCGGKLVDCDPQ